MTARPRAMGHDGPVLGSWRPMLAWRAGAARP